MIGSTWTINVLKLLISVRPMHAAKSSSSKDPAIKLVPVQATVEEAYHSETPATLKVCQDLAPGQAAEISKFQPNALMSN